MSKGIVYLLTGSQHLLSLAVSLYTLRKFYQGSVVLFTDHNSAAIDSLVRDAGLIVLPVHVRPGLRNGTLLFKTELHQYVPFHSFLFLDADTLLRSDPSVIIPDAHDDRIILTQHGNWTTQNDQMEWRLGGLREQGLIHPDLVKTLVEMNAPAVNTGIFAMSKNCKMLSVWTQTTMGFDCFWLNLHDEIAAQVLYPFFPNYVYDDRYNCDPRVSTRPTEDVVIYHCCTRRYGLSKSSDYWFKNINEVLDCNFGDIQFWYEGNPDLVRGRVLRR
jgi:hypothetical protein